MVIQPAQTRFFHDWKTSIEYIYGVCLIVLVWGGDAPAKSRPGGSWLSLRNLSLLLTVHEATSTIPNDTTKQSNLKIYIEEELLANKTPE